MVLLEFFIDNPFRHLYVPGVDSGSNRNEYQRAQRLGILRGISLMMGIFLASQEGLCSV